MQLNERVARPRGIFPSLPGGMDLVIKDYFDTYRGSLPPELEGEIDASHTVLMEDVATLNKWRNWRSGLTWHDTERDAQLFGALDDCLTTTKKMGSKTKMFYMPLDYKTRGFPPKDGASEMYYQHQLDAYSLLLSENGYPVTDHAYLLYYYPREVKENGMVAFHTKPVKIATDIERARTLFQDAVDILKSAMPKEHTAGACEFGVWYRLAREFD